MNGVLRASKSLHRWLGLGLLLYLAWMGGTGVLLNHPSLLAGIEWPRALTPPQYRARDWNRSSLVDLGRLPGGDLVLAGRGGVWIQRAGEARPRAWMDGDWPRAIGRRAARDLLPLPDGTLLAAGDGGLFRRAPGASGWRALPLPGRASDRHGEAPALLSLTPLGPDRLLLCGESGLWLSRADGSEARPLELPRVDEAPGRTLVEAVFALHDGSLWGLPGRLAVDGAGLALLFLCATAAWTWLLPRWLRRRPRGPWAPGPRAKGAYRWLHRHHLSVGLAALPPLLILSATGFFMRPPPLALLVGPRLPERVLPAPAPTSPWEGRIQGALVDRADSSLWIAADGLWRAPVDLSAVGLRLRAPFERAELPLPIFVMGPTVFREAREGGLLVGSFGGLYHLPSGAVRATDALRGGPAADRPAIRPAEEMVTGLVVGSDGRRWATLHEGGLRPLALDTGERTALGLPDASRMPVPPADARFAAGEDRATVEGSTDSPTAHVPEASSDPVGRLSPALADASGRAATQGPPEAHRGGRGSSAAFAASRLVDSVPSSSADSPSRRGSRRHAEPEPLAPLSPAQAGLPPLPPALEASGLPLWNACFELHNGRFFKDWIGGFYILLTPLAALLTFLLTLTGGVDWWRRQCPRRLARAAARTMAGRAAQEE